MLDSVLKRLPAQNDANVLVGFETSDDAGVYRLQEDLALVQTVDFLTPIADDPFVYGQIAAANSLSDIYAMGGKPVSALSVVGFPASGEPEMLEQIFRGGLSKMNEAHCAVIGGHSVRDEELKFGYAVTGLIHPQRIWRNGGAKPDDALILTKPIGTGLIATALKQGSAPLEAVQAATASMVQLNSAAAEALLELLPGVVHAVTDITGFGLLGHAREMAIASGTSLEIEHKRIPYLTGAVDAARGGFLAGGLKNNREFVAGCVAFADGVAEEYRNLLFDPQTSGGLLAAIETAHAADALAKMKQRNVQAVIIGRAVEKTSQLIFVF